MTRDTYRVHDDRESASDAEMYAALWAAAPFPRLPDDAPAELKAFTIDVDDPKRVYAIHRASRRHHFQLLVERYILQIRYGCQSKSCNTATCFSCRKRLAGAAPVRRYNATSARTLAIYMASQDNPEQGLCHNFSAPRPGPEARKPSKAKGSPVEFRAAPVRPQDPRNGRRSAEPGQTIEEVKIATKDSGREEKQSGRKNSMGGTISRDGPDLSILEEATPTDHRSFVQNVFGTVAFKMLEWLTPRNLDRLTGTEDKNTIMDDGSPIGDIQMDGSKDAKTDAEKGKTAAVKLAAPFREISKVDSPRTEIPVEAGNKSLETAIEQPKEQKAKHTSSLETSSKTSVPLAPRKPVSGPPVEPNRLDGDAQPKRPSSLRTKTDHLEPTPKEAINKMASELTNDVKTQLSSNGISMPRRKMSKPLITSPQLQMADMAPTLHDLKYLPPARVMNSESPSLKDDESEASHGVQAAGNKSQIIPREGRSPERLPKRRDSPPQSLSYLSIEVIGLLCDIMQTDGTSEKHFLQPQTIDAGLLAVRKDALPLTRDISRRGSTAFSSSAKQEWRSFIEQSFFYVLSRPEPLLKTFCDGESRLFDTQTIWYLMLRMTRVAPSLVFDSLWNLAGSLFKPPQKLEAAYDWAKEFQSQDGSSQAALSNYEAAQIINICLHALVAAAPLTYDARQLANMSRIRSYGLAIAARDESSLEPSALCLQYEDAFTNDLALRLARRVFAAISTRRRFTELLNLQLDLRKDEKPQPDVLETVLGTLKFLDVDSPPILDFEDDERDLHENRVPTLMLDWARTVMLQGWEGAAEVPSDGPFGGALATMAAIYKNRKSLLLGDIHFRTEYFAERLDPVDMPLEWLSFNQNKRTVHLLDYPYLFNPATLVTYFRAINYSRMNQSYETASATGRLIYHTIAEGTGSLIPVKHRRDMLYERLRTAASRFTVLEIRRDHVLLDTFNSIWRREERELMRPLKIRLGEEGGEEGMDSGGVQQEYFRLAIAEALDPDYGTFTVDTRTKMAWFQPGSPEPLWKFELIGMIVSMAVYNGLTLPVTFPKAMYRKLLDEEVTELHHIADGWPDLTNGLTSLLEWDEKDGLVEDIFARTYEFSVEQFGTLISRQMDTGNQWPQFSEMHSSTNPEDAPMVTNENRNSYVSDYIRWLTDVSVRPQFEAFKKGFFACIDRRSVSLFDPDTLQSVVEGVQDIDISELRRVTRYIGFDGEASHRTVRDFWSLVKRYDHEQKKKLLEFVTASDRVPVGGIRNLQFILQRNGVDDDHLPSSYTCYGTMLLPEYSSKEVLREKLAMALENSKGFGFA
ncbi:hypothetical protein L207DRAFT_475712 [Hyaloscypha variabilis F]|uniref:HECT-type E3 ubiquitin transferase n=1 Tax=Hyaloscypha variabilis (strain UAMH 11265 / GT02V1 / F) TaxID=1149755 RepID=A0A2J6QS38_HYAVF|nr:hypothetical protein L207DRAFT_475712 [Hyaloscypha variabilis F]